MPFDIKKTNQAGDLEHTIKASLYCNLSKAAAASNGTGWVRISGVVVGPTCAVLTLARRIVQVIENLFKGVINIIGSRFSDQCSFTLGLGQLLWETPKNIIILPFSAVHACYDVVITIYSMARSPKDYADQQWVKYDTEEKDKRALESKRVRDEQFKQQQKIHDDNARRVEAENLKKQNKLIGRFTNQLIFTQTLADDNPNLLIALKHVSWAYENGQGVAQSYSKALPCLERAANLGDVESMLEAGKWYLDGKIHVPSDAEKAYAWFERAQAKGSKEAGVLLQSRCFSDIRLRKTIEESEKPLKTMSTAIDFIWGTKGPINYKEAVKLCREGCKYEQSRENCQRLLAGIFTRYPNYATDEDKQSAWYHKIAEMNLSGLLKQIDAHPEGAIDYPPTLQKAGAAEIGHRMEEARPHAQQVQAEGSREAAKPLEHHDCAEIKLKKVTEAISQDMEEREKPLYFMSATFDSIYGMNGTLRNYKIAVERCREGCKYEESRKLCEDFLAAILSIYPNYALDKDKQSAWYPKMAELNLSNAGVLQEIEAHPEGAIDYPVLQETGT